MVSAAELTARVLAEPGCRLTEAEAEALAASPDRDLMAEKILAIYFHQTGQIDRSLTHFRTVFEAEPDGQSALNIAICLVKLGKLAQARAFAEAESTRIPMIEWHDLMGWISTRQNRIPDAVAHGNRALALKDASAPPAPALEPVIRAFDASRPTRNVISFSLFGEDPRYLEGASRNAVVARALYPGWVARFYIDDRVPEAVVDALLAEGAQVMQPQGWPAERYGLFWRFMVEDDPDVDLYLVRDADALMTIKERVAVDDWLTSGRAFHLMRDLPSHAELVLAGMWGAHRGNLGSMATRVRDFLADLPDEMNPKMRDQLFTRQVLWPVIRQSVCAHDTWFDFGEVRRFRPEYPLPPERHIGQNDWGVPKG